MAHSLSHIIPRVGPHMAHINWFGKGNNKIEIPFILFVTAGAKYIPIL